MRRIAEQEYVRAYWLRVLDRDGWSAAKFRGRCVRCWTVYAPGTPIRRADVGGGWVGVCCAEPQEQYERNL